VLVVDDEENIRVVLRTLLRRNGYEVETAASAEDALSLVETFGPDVILTDVRMPKMSGLDLLATLKAKGSPATVIVMSAFGNVELALEAIKGGAYDYIHKPFKPDEVVLTLRKAEEREALRRENRALKEEIRKEHQFESILAKSEAMRDVFRTIAKIAERKTTVLVYGESGVGKELVAKAIHHRSPRRPGAFVAVNCGARTAAPSRRTCWRASCSATSAVRSRTPTPTSGGSSRRPTAGRCSSTRSGSCPSRCR
jgi:two-component system, NtrC family, response regulator AtoC